MNFHDRDFRGKNVLIIGAGLMAEHYAKALSLMNIKNVTIISRKESSSQKFFTKYGFKPFSGGYENLLPKLDIFDLVIIATPIHELRVAASCASSCGNKNILVEKPGCLYSNLLDEWAKEVRKTDLRIRIAYNRLVYPSIWKLKKLIADDEKVTSCHYTFTEWVHLIDFTKYQTDIYQRWGIANSLHVIGMAHSLIGMPKQMNSLRSGKLSWHPSGAIFAGSGIAGEDILFTYLADWNSAGRWGIEIMTTKNSYRLIPLEKLSFCPIGSVHWQNIEIKAAYPEAKEGICEELAVMLDQRLETHFPLVSLDSAKDLTRLGEQIFGYPPAP